ncbi:hypothetical protein OG474_40985 [Kribbella sp. NBC_01505]|uniref:hypothetical protein n=1 Tax=Kribbella sp. NBC_01505 TaxID=2903580 RepID=UPI0038647D57
MTVDFDRAGDLVVAGQLKLALQLLDDGAFAHRLDDPAEAADAYYLAAGLCRLLGDNPGAIDRARAAIGVDADPIITLRATMLVASAAVASGDRSEVLAALPPAKAGEDVVQRALLTAHTALEDGALKEAVRAAVVARRQALQDVEPLGYLTAVLIAAQATERLGDRLSVYRLLATAKATLTDLLGAEAAAALVEPELVALRSKWGADEFGRVKAAQVRHGGVR